jgi:long-subunit acyl-CoA synthetase (AMP-forming)
VILCTSDKIDIVVKHSQKIVKYIVSMDLVDEEKKESVYKMHGIKVYNFEDVLINGKNNIVQHNPPKPDDVALICFTSGSFLY